MLTRRAMPWSEVRRLVGYFFADMYTYALRICGGRLRSYAVAGQQMPHLFDRALRQLYRARRQPRFHAATGVVLGGVPG